MFRLSADEHWFPARIAGLTADIANEHLVVVLAMQDEPVTARFPLEARAALFAALHEWLYFIAKTTGVPIGPSLETWASVCAAKLCDFADARAADGEPP